MSGAVPVSYFRDHKQFQSADELSSLLFVGSEESVVQINSFSAVSHLSLILYNKLHGLHGVLF